MTGGINKVQLIRLSVPRRVFQRDALRLDRDPPLTLKVHGIENLICHLPVAETTTVLDKPVGQRGLAMVDVGNDREVAYVAKCRHRYCPEWGRT